MRVWAEGKAKQTGLIFCRGGLFAQSEYKPNHTNGRRYRLEYFYGIASFPCDDNMPRKSSEQSISVMSHTNQNLAKNPAARFVTMLNRQLGQEPAAKLIVEALKKSSLMIGLPLKIMRGFAGGHPQKISTSKTKNTFWKLCNRLNSGNAHVA